LQIMLLLILNDYILLNSNWRYRPHTTWIFNYFITGV
jgi:hypothetical protein